MEIRRGSVRLATLAAAGLTLLGGAVGSVQAQIPVSDCGTTISAPGNYVLTADLACPAGDGVKIISGGVNFNLAGFTIDGGGDPVAGNDSRCTDGGVGIKVGSDVLVVHITGGTVKGFPIGIQLNGVGCSRVDKMTVTRNCFYGVQLNKSNHNQLTGNFVNENGSGLILPEGFFCGGVNPVCGGISVSASSSNDISSQDLRRNAQIGLLMDADSTGNMVRDSDASQTGSFGFLGIGIDDAGSSNIIRNNTSSGNTGGGIHVRGSNDVIQRNTASGNGPASGGSGLVGTGIVVRSGPGSNVLQGNTALSNTGTDLMDENAGCDADTWATNVFGTKNQACIN